MSRTPLFFQPHRTAGLVQSSEACSQELGQDACLHGWQTRPYCGRMNQRSVQPGKVVSRDPETHSGDLVFTATRVPVDTLIDYLKSDHSVEDFLKDFPSVERWQVESYLELSSAGIDQLRILKRTA